MSVTKNAADTSSVQAVELLAPDNAGNLLEGSIRTTAGGPAPNQTQKNYSGLATTSTGSITTITLETVTAGKTYFITDVCLTTDSPSTSSIDARLQAAGADIFRNGLHSLAPIDMAGIETQPTAAGGQVVTLVLPITPSAQKVWYNIYGVEGA